MALYSSQQVLVEPNLVFFDRASVNSSIVQNDTAWDSVHARFNDIALPFVAAFPLFITGLVLLCLIFRWFVPRLPIWMSNFVEETKEEYEEAENVRKRPRLSYWTAGLFLAPLAGVILQATSIAYHGFQLPVLLLFISWVVATLLVAILRPGSTSLSLMFMFLGIFTSQVTLFMNKESSWTWKDVPDGLTTLVAFAAFTVILATPLRSPELPLDGISPPYGPPTNKLRSPEDNLSLFQWTFITWLEPLLAIGKQRQLNDDDVWMLGFEFQHRRLHQAFRVLKGSVFRRLLKANSQDLFLSSIYVIFQSVSYSLSAVFIQQFLFTLGNPEASLRSPIVYGFIQWMNMIILTVIEFYRLWISRRCYERSRGEMITMLFEKTLKRKMAVMTPEDKEASNGNVSGEPLNGSADGADNEQSGGAAKTFFKRMGQAMGCIRRDKIEYTKVKDPAPPQASLGKILNLMRSDVYEVSQVFWDFPDFVRDPAMIFMSIYLIWVLMGPACLIGAVTVVVSQIMTAIITRVLVRWEKQRRAATDVKLQVISQFIEAIRHLRWYGWQNAWLEDILTKRQHELNLRVVTSIFNMLIQLFNQLGSGLLLVVAFWAYTVLLGQELKLEISFSVFILFSQLDVCMRAIPGSITKLINAFVALDRIEQFMNEPDKPENERYHGIVTGPHVNGASFAWPGGDLPVLKAVTLSFSPGLNVICGKVAAGKTALLLALLGELDVIDGAYQRFDYAVGYCAQSPWLQSMSIRDNILFHAPYDPERYRQVVEACALNPDFANFKDGDLSLIGENGIGLSGGQRARVALARAMYTDAKILMLDDPLSSLDHQTAQWIVRKCFIGPLAENRTIILVTHRLDICSEVADRFVEVANGTTRMVKDISEISAAAQSHITSDNISSAKGSQDNSSNKDATAPDADAVPEKFIEDERREHGGIKKSIYWEYIKSGKILWWIILMFCFTMFRFLQVAQDWFLKEWGEAYGRPEERLSTSAATPITRYFEGLPSPGENVRPWLIGFGVLTVVRALFNVAAQGIMVIIVYNAGKSLFARAIHKVAHASFRYYDITPLGRLMNRMTSDVGALDGNISREMQEFTGWAVTWVLSLIVVGSVTPAFFVFSLAIFGGTVWIFLKFLPTSQSLRRLETVSLSPLMSDFGAMVDGLTTVRAFGAQSRFQDRVITSTDQFQKMDHFYWSAQMWVNFRMDMLADFAMFGSSMLALYTQLSPGIVAFVLVSCGQFLQATHRLCQCYGQLQMDFVSVERIVELLEVEQEDPGSLDPPAYWPTYSGDLIFDQATIRYAPHLDPALNELSFTIRGGSTTAVVGRTGSGKSTLALSLLATIVPDSGSLSIDGMDTTVVNKQALRSRVTFVAQDPVLFPGSLRKNLDPMTEHSDEDCERVIDRVCPSYSWTLGTTIDAGGKNLSQGQRQLIGLARAILRQSSIVVLDEATASIDLGTSREVQRVLREELKGSTVVTIAHRVEAVRGADRYVVLGKGKLVEEGRVDENGALVADDAS